MPRVIEGRLQAGRNLAVDAAHSFARILQRLVERFKPFAQVFANRFERQSVELVNDAGELASMSERVLSITGSSTGSRVQSIFALGALEGVEGDVELPGKQAAAPELRAHSPLLDQALHKGMRSWGSAQGFRRGRLLLAQARDQPLGKDHDLHVLG